MKKVFTLLTLALLSIGSAWAEAVTLGLTQTVTEDPKTLGDPTYTGTTNVAVEAAFGTKCEAYNGSKTIMGYTAAKNFRKTEKGTTYSGDCWLGFKMTVASGYKISLSNLKATIWSSDAAITWKVVIENSAGTALYTSAEGSCNTTSTSDSHAVDVAAPTNVADLAAGSYYVKVTMFQNGGNKYFAVPYLTVDATVEEDATPTYTITANVATGQEEYGIIDNAGDNEVVENGSISFTATGNEGYAFEKWTKASDSSTSTENPLNLTSVTANETYTASFVKLYKVTFDLEGYGGTITDKTLNQYSAARGIDEKYAAVDGSYTIPSYAHRYVYRTGYVFDKWTDGTNTYNSGETITLTGDITLTPTWAITTQSLDDSQAQTTVTWTFALSDILFNDWQSDSNYGYNTVTAVVNGEKIAVPMQITKGKVSNWGRTDALAQTNKKTQFTIPAISGMVVSIPNANKELSSTTIAGSTDYTGTGTKSVSYTYTGTDATIDIVIGEDNQYLNSIVVTYPVTAASITITPAKEYTTYVTPAIMNFDGTGLTAYKATAATTAEVTMMPVTAVPAGTPLVLKKGTDASYDVPVAASADAITDNKLVASDGVTPIGGDGVWDYILSDGLFYRATEGVLAKGKAYLHLDAAPADAARELVMSFGDEATGIDSVTRDALTNGKVYNLQGQEVKNAQKGIFIVNGKKVVLK